MAKSKKRPKSVSLSEDEIAYIKELRKLLNIDDDSGVISFALNRLRKEHDGFYEPAGESGGIPARVARIAQHFLGRELERRLKPLEEAIYQLSAELKKMKKRS